MMCVQFHVVSSHADSCNAIKIQNYILYILGSYLEKPHFLFL